MHSISIKKENGKIILYINDKLVPPLIYHISDRAQDISLPIWQKNIAQFHSAGIDIVGICEHLNADWTEAGYSGESLMNGIKNAVKANGQVKLVIRLNLTPPYWWMRKHKEELIVYEGIESVDLDNDDVFAGINANQYRVSFVSKIWREEIKRILTQVVSIIDNSPYAENVIALQPAYGTCGEWHMFGPNADFSKPMLVFFRQYLKDKYVTVKELQKAWGEKVDFETAELASWDMRTDYKEDGNYLFPETDMRALDSLKCYQLAAPTAIVEFAKTIKSASNGRLLVGSFYAYHFGCGDVCSRLIEPYVVFNDDSIDYLAAPSGYTYNKRSGNTEFLRYMFESARLHGKLFFCEMDQGFKSWSVCRNDDNIYYTCKNNEDYIALITRSIMENVLRGMGAWFFDHNHPASQPKLEGYWDDAKRLTAIKNIKEFCDRLTVLRPSFEATTDVLIVYDAPSVYHYARKSEMHNTWCEFDIMDGIAKSGAGYDRIYLQDIELCEIERYKCVLFIECVQMSKNQYDFIMNKVMGENRTVAFMGKNGYIVDGKTSVSNITKLYGGVIQKGLFVEKKNNYTLVTVDNFRYDKQFYRNLFTQAGAHIYSNGEEVICANNNLVMVYALNTKDKVIHLTCGDVKLPDKEFLTAVYDNKTGERLL